MWTHIASASSEGSQLDLYERNGLYMIRANGWELMNGEYHASEDQLGRLAGLLATAPHPKILVGGLGLGYALASLLETLNQGIRLAEARVTVAERSGAVLRWFGTHISPRLTATLPSGVRLVESDVADHLGVDRRWDVIVLDVDNGPEALSTPSNAMLYGEHGLARWRDSLAPSGHLLLWTGFEDANFVDRARTAGFSVTQQSIPFPNRADQAHVLYVLSRQPLSAADHQNGFRSATAGLLYANGRKPVLQSVRMENPSVRSVDLHCSGERAGESFRECLPHFKRQPFSPRKRV